LAAGPFPKFSPLRPACLWSRQKGYRSDAPNLITANTGLIPVNGVPNTAIHDNVPGSHGVGTNTSSTTGSGNNIFAGPAAAFASLRPVLLSADTSTVHPNPSRGLPFKNIDMSFSKGTAVTETHPDSLLDRLLQYLQPPGLRQALPRPA
jgi:hypothetical protein